MIKEYWQRSVYLPFIDVAFAEAKPCFTKEKRSHHERCRLDPEVIIEHDENKTNEPNQCPAEKWDHVMLLPDIFMEN